MRLFFPIVLACGLAGCAASPTGGTVSVQQACVAAMPSLAAGAALPNATANSIAAYGNAFCGPLLTGNPPATMNGNSAAWVLGLVSSLAPLLVTAL